MLVGFRIIFYQPGFWGGVWHPKLYTAPVSHKHLDSRCSWDNHWSRSLILHLDEVVIFEEVLNKKVNKATLGCNFAIQEGTLDSLQFLTNLASPCNYQKCENVVWSHYSQNRSVVFSSVRCKKGSWEKQGGGMSERQWKSHCGPGKPLLCMSFGTSWTSVFFTFNVFLMLSKRPITIWLRWFLWLSIHLQVVTTDLPAGSTSVNLHFHHFCGEN